MTPFISLTRLRAGTAVSVNIMAISYLVPLTNGTQVQFGDHGLLVKESADEVEAAISTALGYPRASIDVDLGKAKGGRPPAKGATA